jgi:coenzyme F420 hydrogenase subunit beta
MGAQRAAGMNVMNGEHRESPETDGATGGQGAWSHLAAGVVDTGRCTGCGGCVIACPWGVLSIDRSSWVPRLGAAARVDHDRKRCVHEERGCTLCARACPRLGDWESEGDRAALGRVRDADDPLGVWRSMWLVSATDPEMAAAGQDGGLATALLVYALEHGVIDAALVSYADQGLRPRPGVARTREEVLAAAGSRYTYSPNPLAFAEAARLGAARLGLVGVGCQTSVPAVAAARGANRLAHRFTLVVGLLCSRTFTDGLFTGLLEPRLGIRRDQVVRMNIKGKLQVWGMGGTDRPPDWEVPLRDCDPFDRPGCRYCPDFSAGHADLSLGGIGRHAARTFAIVRSERAERLLAQMERDGWVTRLPAEEVDPAAVALIRRMAARQRGRWPTDAVG